MLDLMVVEDSIGTSRLVESILAELIGPRQYEIVHHDDAWGRFTEKNPRVVMLDLVAPDNGWALLSRVRTSARKHTPVVVFSGSGGFGSVTDAFDAGANAYFVKPFGVPATRSLLASICAHWIHDAMRYPHE